MSQAEARIRWTTSDLELFPDNGNRYEIIDAELLVTRAPNWKHQKVIVNICGVLNDWSEQTGEGEAVPGAAVIFTDEDNVIPDVVWVQKDRLAATLDEAGHLTAAPDLAVEGLSPGAENGAERSPTQTEALLDSRRSGILDRRSTPPTNPSSPPRKCNSRSRCNTLCN